MYPRNAASPERIAVGAVVNITTGAVQTSGVSISVRGQGGTSGAGGGTIAYDNGIVEYTPLQAETNYTSFVVIAYASGCIPVSQTIVTSASATAGYAGTDQSVIANPTASVNLSGTTVGTVTNLTNLPSIPNNWLTATGIAASALNGKGDWLLSSGYTAPDSAATVAGAVWDVTLSGHLTAGTTGNALNAAGSAGDPWSTSLPGAYGAGTAGKIVGDNIDAAISSRLATASYTAADNTSITAIKAKTDNLPASPAAVGSAMALTSGERSSVADAVLDRDMSTGTDSGSPTVRTVRQALRFLRNKWTVSGGTLTVYKEDDTTSSWTGSVTTTAGADPVTGNDPA